MDLNENMEYLKRALQIVLPGCRRNFNLTLEDAANELGVDVSTLESWEKGEVLPDARTLQLITKNYGHDIDEILDPNIIKNYHEDSLRPKPDTMSDND